MLLESEHTHTHTHLEAIELSQEFMIALFGRREKVDEVFMAAEPRPVLGS
jgi:hypothetical protein